jgi:23S rRNA (uracil1939-C5)-methyltransferase
MLSCDVPAAVCFRADPRLRSLIDALSIRDRVPQIEVAIGDEATVLVFRHLLPLTEADHALLRQFAEDNRVHVWLPAAGPESAAPLAPSERDSLRYSLPEFGIRIAFEPTDFTQVNDPINRALVSRVIRLLHPQPGERIADLFCGLGNFSLPIARLGADVIGFEASGALVERARANARANGLVAQFEAADLFRSRIDAFGPFDKIVLDPPREGAIETLKRLGAAGPAKIVYVSCDPATLARDAALLVHTQGYSLQAAGVVNMFPHTAHVESVAVFGR